MKSDASTRTYKYFNNIDFTEIFEFFKNSLKYGFNIMYNLLNNQCKENLLINEIYILKINELDFLLSKYENNLKNYLVNSFSDFYGYTENVAEKSIPYDIFMMWILKDHDFEITYGNTKLKIAITLMCLSDIGISYE
jgi:hypothetical protein